MDPQQQQQLMASMGAFFMVFAIFGFAVLAFMVFLFWRIFTRAGLAGPLALLVLVPGIGILIVICILAFAEWRVIPAPSPYGAFPPPYPPAPPPTQY